MKRFVNLSVEDQAVIVLVTILEQVMNGARSKASVDHPIAELFELVSNSFNVPAKEVNLVADAVAKGGIIMLPGFIKPEEDLNGTDATVA